MVATARILFLDIETSPIRAYVWDIWKVDVALNQIEKDWGLLSFAAKWLGEKNVIYNDLSKKRDKGDDRDLCVSLHKLLTDADIVVAQNGRAFDIPKINARMITHGLPPPSPYRVVDTLELARKSFGFTSNRLEHLSRLLCSKKKSVHKRFPGFSLWTECLKGNRQAWAEMKAYNIQDVLTLEELYLKIRSWSPSHPNVAVFSDKEIEQCPRCGSENVIRNGLAVTSTGKYQRYQCSDCGSYARGAKNTQSVDRKKKLLRPII